MGEEPPYAFFLIVAWLGHTQEAGNPLSSHCPEGLFESIIL